LCPAHCPHPPKHHKNAFQLSKAKKKKGRGKKEKIEKIT